LAGRATVSTEDDPPGRGEVGKRQKLRVEKIFRIFLWRIFLE